MAVRKITILGCGSSTGVPMVGCSCSICKSENPRNKRTRSSILVESDTTSILIDTSPDLRYQALKNNMRRLDGVLYTHSHTDHINGIDELRSFNVLNDKVIPVYSDKETLDEITRRFEYVFRPNPPERTAWSKPCLTKTEITMFEQFSIGDINIMPFMQYHGKDTSIGYKMDDFAYSTDLSSMPDESAALLNGIGLWVVDALRISDTKSPTHFTFAETMAWINKIKPEKAILTHMGHEADYDNFNNNSPNNVTPAHDGMVVNFK